MQYYQNVLIPLDCLLDTRFGTIVTKFPASVKSMDIEGFVNRDHKRIWDLVGCNKRDWVKAWDNRNIVTLSASRPTGLFYALKGILASKAIQGITSPIHYPLHVFVDTWPYNLNAEELEEFRFAIMSSLPDNVNCTMVRHRPDKLTPSLIKDVYQSFFSLDLAQWLSQHREALTECKIPTVTMYYSGWLDDDSDALKESITESKQDPYRVIKQYLSEYIALEAVDSSLFSIPYSPLK